MEHYTVEMVPNPSGMSTCQLPALCLPDGSVKHYLGRDTTLADAVVKATKLMARWACPRIVVDSWTTCGRVVLACTVGELR